MRDVFATAVAPLQAVPASFYDLLDSVCPADGLARRQPLHRICSLMRKMRAQTYVDETLIPDAELEEERQGIERRCGVPGVVTMTVRRLTFFCSKPDPLDWQQAGSLSNDHLLAYVVVVTVRLPDGTDRTYVYEAVVRPPSIVLSGAGGQPRLAQVTNYYVHSMKTFQTTIGTSATNRSFELSGAYFTQQNDLTSVCAHASLRMAMNSSTIFAGPKLTTARINQILGLDCSVPEKSVGHYGTPLPRAGLTQKQMSDAVSGLGANLIAVNFADAPSIEYDHFIYPFVESGCPLVLQIDGWNYRSGGSGGPLSHVVAVVGHTLNSDRWEPEARPSYGAYPIQGYAFAADWADHYLIGDDNFGMYHALPSASLRNWIVPWKNPDLHASMAWAIVPLGVTVSGLPAERLAANRLALVANFVQVAPPLPWLERLRSDGLIICRTSLRSRDEYLTHLASAVVGYDPAAFVSATVQAALNALPDWVWLSEFSLSPLHTANKRKLVDVVVSASASEAEINADTAVKFGWMPGVCFFGSPIQYELWPIRGHVPIVRGRGNVPELEW